MEAPKVVILPIVCPGAPMTRFILPRGYEQIDQTPYLPPPPPLGVLKSCRKIPIDPPIPGMTFDVSRWRQDIEAFEKQILEELEIAQLKARVSRLLDEDTLRPSASSSNPFGSDVCDDPYCSFTNCMISQSQAAMNYVRALNDSECFKLYDQMKNTKPPDFEVVRYQKKSKIVGDKLETSPENIFHRLAHPFSCSFKNWYSPKQHFEAMINEFKTLNIDGQLDPPLIPSQVRWRLLFLDVHVLLQHIDNFSIASDFTTPLPFFYWKTAFKEVLCEISFRNFTIKSH